MCMINIVLDSEEMGKEVIVAKRVEVADYSSFIKHDPLEVILSYLSSCRDEGVDPTNFPDNLCKRKRKTKKTQPSLEVTTVKVYPKSSLQTVSPPSYASKQAKSIDSHRRLLSFQDDDEDEEENFHTNTAYVDSTLPQNLRKSIFVETHATSNFGYANTSSAPFPTIIPLQSLSIFSTFGTISKPPPKESNKPIHITPSSSPSDQTKPVNQTLYVISYVHASSTTPQKNNPSSQTNSETFTNL